MSDATVEEVEEETKSSKMPLILGLVAGLIGGGGGFFVTYSGMLLAPEVVEEQSEEIEVTPLPDVTYVEIEPMIVSIGSPTSGKHLRFRAQLEVPNEHSAEVQKYLPRIVDMMNSYLRALELTDLDSSIALLKIRSHLLRRIDVVIGEGRVNDLLVMEFVLN